MIIKSKVILLSLEIYILFKIKHNVKYVQLQNKKFSG